MSMNLRHAAALLTVLVCTSPGVAFAGGTCDAKLVGNSYDCTISFQTGEGGAVLGTETRNNCFEFITGGLSNNFDLVGSGLPSNDLGCECEVTSSINLFFSHFSADAFECVGDLVQVHGRVDSDKLRGQASESNGSIFQFVCRKTSTACE